MHITCTFSHMKQKLWHKERWDYRIYRNKQKVIRLTLQKKKKRWN